MSEFFIEIGVEEIPVAEINPASEYLSHSIKHMLDSEHITFTVIKTYFTPRRLALCVEGLSDKGEPSITTYTGPRKEAAFDKDGTPTQAAIGFARSKGVDVKLLKIVKLDKGEFIQVEVKKPGVSAKSLLKEKFPGIILGIPFRKSMRWGSGDIKFIRPIRWMVVIYNGKVLPITIGGVKSSPYTQGLRTSTVRKIKVTGCDAWLKAMKKERILPEFEYRREKIKTHADVLARKAGGQAVPDNELLDTITNLVESPSAIMGSFDQRFMNLPEEVIMSVMKTQQKYIPVMRAVSGNNQSLGELMPYFIGISNNPYGDKTVIKKGYERVLHARLEDAEFYYHQDIKQPLESYVELLKGMAFYPKLGSLYDKTERIVALSSYLCDTIITPLHPLAKGETEGFMEATLKAARLCKADLATRLVSEFPELQGIIGHYYLLKKAPEDKITAFAVKEHYNSQPQSMPGVIVSLADKIDSLVGFFSIGEAPTGTQDPYGLRRAAISILLTMSPIPPLDGPRSREDLRVNIKELIDFSIGQYKHITDKDGLKNSLLNFLYTRLEGIFTERYAHIKKLIDAVIATEPHDIYEADQRINFFKDIVFNPDFEPMFLAFKRVINISKNRNPGEIISELLAEQSEIALYDRYLEVEREIQSALANKDYKGYIGLIQKLVEPINTFFDKVLVMSDDDSIKNNRLNLLAKIKNLVMQILDISKLI